MDIIMIHVYTVLFMYLKSTLSFDPGGPLRMKADALTPLKVLYIASGSGRSPKTLW